MYDVIWKYDIDELEPCKPFCFAAPKGSRVLCVKLQHGRVVFWVRRSDSYTQDEFVKMHVLFVPTGLSLKRVVTEEHRYIDTVYLDSFYVAHFFAYEG